MKQNNIQSELAWLSAQGSKFGGPALSWLKGRVTRVREALQTHLGTKRRPSLLHNTQGQSRIEKKTALPLCHFMSSVQHGRLTSLLPASVLPSGKPPGEAIQHQI